MQQLEEILFPNYLKLGFHYVIIEVIFNTLGYEMHSKYNSGRRWDTVAITLNTLNVKIQQQHNLLKTMEKIINRKCKLRWSILTIIICGL